MWVPCAGVPASEKCPVGFLKPMASAPHTCLPAVALSAFQLFGVWGFSATFLLCCQWNMCFYFLFSLLFSDAFQEERGNTLLMPRASNQSSPSAFCLPGIPGSFWSANFIFSYFLVLLWVCSFKTCIFSVISLRFWWDG